MSTDASAVEHIRDLGRPLRFPAHGVTGYVIPQTTFQQVDKMSIHAAPTDDQEFLHLWKGIAEVLQVRFWTFERLLSSTLSDSNYECRCEIVAPQTGVHPKFQVVG